MKNKYKIKQIILIILIIVIIGGVISNIIYKKKTAVIVTIDNNIITENKTAEEKPENPNIFNLCYYNSDKTDKGLYDISWLKLNISGDKINGEFNNILAEKDSKVGLFEGTVGPLIQNIMGRKATVWWNSFAEGMNVKEELAIVFGDGSATVGFGEMINRGDGVYVYKNKENLTYSKSMGQIDCETLDEKILVEKYIKENIKTIATNSPVLGGNWHTISVIANPIAHSGEVTYEDGHIQSKAKFIYNYEKNTQVVAITNFKLIK